MMVQRFGRGILLGLVLGLVGLLLPQTILAQGSAGLRISPATFEPTRNIEPGERLQFDLQITNVESRDRTLYLTPRNISSVGPGGEPNFTTDTTELTGFELADWLSFNQDQVNIGPGQTETVEVTLSVPNDAPPGSHFGGINIASEAPRLRESGAGIAFGVTNIVTVRVAGDAVERAQIRSLATDRYVYSRKAVSFAARIENEGNVLIRPLGPVEITNMYGATVATVMVNESRAGVFPGITRDFNFTWEEDGLGFGRYEAVLSMAYGSEGSSRTMSTTVSFWILPMSIIGPAAAVLAVLLLVSYIAVRLYVRQAMYVQSGGRRLVRRRKQTGMPLGLLLLLVMLMVTALFLIILLALFA